MRLGDGGFCPARGIRDVGARITDATWKGHVYALGDALDAIAAAMRSGNAMTVPRLFDIAEEHFAAGVASSSGDVASQVEEYCTELCLSCLRMCVARQMFKEALAIYDHVASRVGSGCKVIWSIIFYCAVEVEEFHRCGDFLARLLECGVPSGKDFVNVVRYFVHLRDVEGFTQTLAALQDRGCVIDPISRNRGLSACMSCSALDMAIEVVTGVRGADMDLIAYHTLIKGYAQAGLVKGCLEFYRQLQTNGLRPSQVTFGLLLDACVRAGELSEAEKLFAELRNSGLEMNVVHYTTFIKGLVAAGLLPKARDTLEEMLASPNLDSDLVAFSMVMKAYSDRGELETVLAMVDRMHESYLSPDEVVFNIVLSCCCSKPLEPARIVSVLERLLGLGLRPSSTTLSVLVKAFSLAKGWSQALDLLERAPERFGVLPELRVFEQLERACIRAGCRREALRVRAAATKRPLTLA